MKIEIDLKDVLHDEYGNPEETLAESIRRQVVAEITQRTAKDVKRQISETVSAVLDAELKAAVQSQMPQIVSNLMDTPYVPVTRYGEKSAETTFRAELLKSIQAEMVYKKTAYVGDRNAFTSAVDSTIAAHVQTFKEQFHKQVDAALVAETVKFVSDSLAQRLGLSK